MRSSPSFWLGVRHGAPFTLVIVPFALLFGIVATEAGLNIAQVMGFSALVIAGAAQFTAVQMLSDNAPTVVVLLAALAVNLRMAMYSAALTPHLGAAPLWARGLIAYILVDETYALAARRFETHPDQPLGHKISYYFGTCATVAPFWYAMTLLGALVGQGIPPEFALDFALPLTFIALVAPALRTPAHVAAAAVSVAGALALSALPYNIGLLIAAAAAMATGAQVELWLQRRTAWTRK
ncbi:putative branched-subunit amino acid permease [Rhodovulum imhoffii]|uniref:Putative branched-subunit amino acid permease n=1 Tax=Rhodovulum imhoffii TaxID=365340 RepID=A0A2T5BUD9_9RHOB|nr:AzlC family ABC transporter permease [Rhodovulum imhoffii]MBK5934504.1 branched-chain amino acid transporter AzlC [Rhodovulum imhoffii]PTN03079.1 putative branched-subunit amino acid permease [Rhodovulum imhoffii]